MDPCTLRFLTSNTATKPTKCYIRSNETDIHEVMPQVWGGHGFGHGN